MFPLKVYLYTPTPEYIQALHDVSSHLSFSFSFSHIPHNSRLHGALESTVAVERGFLQ